jgi:cell division septal protein FtsQ
MSDRLFERTRPAGRPRPAATTTDPTRRTTTRVKVKGRPTRGATPPPSAQPRRRRRINWTRISAAFLCLLLVSATGWLVTGPWLQVRAVSYAGADWTGKDELDAITGPMVGRSLLLIDGAATAEALGSLPGVRTAAVDVGLFGQVHVALVEGDAVAVWRTSAAQLLVAEDGTIVGVQSLDAVITGAHADLPRVTDERETSHDLSVGDQVPQHEVDAARLLADLAPAELGSAGSQLAIAIDGTYGFVLSSPQAGWSAAFGYYGLNPADTPEAVAARLESQASGIRTLFAARPEASVAWIDIRNPGRVYFRARG